MIKYRYKPLVGDSEIRLLHIYPGKVNDPLSGSLVHENLDNNPKFDALSYTWGEPDLNCSISIDGAELAITANLGSALRRLRSGKARSPFSSALRRFRSRIEVVTLWADAICVDQSNIPERSRQVLLMKRIYSECQRGVIHLGEEKDDSELIPGFLEHLYKAYQDLFKTHQPQATPWLEPEVDFPSPPLPDENSPSWSAFRSLIRRPWFRRVWVIQEFVFPRKVLMVCGRWEIDGTWLAVIAFLHLTTFRISLLLEDAQRGGNGTIAKDTMILLYLHGLLRIRHGRKSGVLGKYASTASDRFQRNAEVISSIRNLLAGCKWSNATDPRDHFFALLGLATDLESSEIVPDYSKSLADIERQFARYFIRKGQGLHLLHNAGSFHDSTEIPSWIPEWKAWDPKVFSRIKQDSPASALAGTSIKLGQNADYLFIRGSIIDSVKQLGMEMNIEGSWHDWRAWLSEKDSLVTSLTSYPTSQSLEEAQWRTLLCNETANGETPSTEYCDMYREFRAMVLNTVNTPKNPGDQPRKFPRAMTFFGEMAKQGGARFCISNRGFFGMVPCSTQLGDAIFTVQGDPQAAAFIMRKHCGKDCYKWLGCAYIHDIVNAGKQNFCEIIVC